jgi:hypothetical protein
MNLRALKDEATQLFARGKFQKCIGLYRDLIEQSPGDPNLHLRHAEACRRLGMLLEAVQSYRAAADLFLAEGHSTRGQAVLKIALSLDPANTELQKALARCGAAKPAPRIDTPPEQPALSVVMPPRAPKKETVLVSVEVELPREAAPPPPPPLVHTPPLAEGRASEELLARTAFKPEVRRISSTEIAFRPAPGARWIVLSSPAPIDVRFVEELPLPERAPAHAPN